ncbi:MAG: hypothetical protein A2992_07610 [Elusimicrobia bacterium RIFCSPLOWO2_01_FULL_59_12]|nr:MAG: hypothetical protein A2992_07610 [Elusimicrobia bacterium RIFCSPLOWO2_01_FULL_59_12]
MLRRIAAILLAMTSLAHAARSEIRNGEFYVDGEPFYVVGVGYSSLRPHQKPGVSYAQTNRHWMEMDFRRIKAAHFNTIRTWDALDPTELALAKKYGLMVLQGIRLDPRQDFSDIHNQESCVAQVATIARQTKDADNVLGYLVMTEPALDAVVSSGEEETLRFFRRLKRAIQDIDPRPVSMDSWLPLAFLDHSLWDFVTFNTFAFAPQAVNHALGYAGYNRWLANRFAADRPAEGGARQGRPFIVGETGGYAVSKSSWSKYGGCGGLSEYDQSLRNVESLRGAIEGHASGSVLASWLDAWHYPEVSDVHADEPWAWNGLLGIPTDSQKDMKGIPRRAYYDVMQHNLAVVVEPKSNHLYPVADRIPLRVFTPGVVAGVDWTLNGGEWRSLEGSGRGGWHGFVQLPKTAKRRQRVTVRAVDGKNMELARKEVSFVAEVPAERVSIGLLEMSKKTGLMSCPVRITDGHQRPIARRKVFFGCYFPSGWRESSGVQVTNAQGDITLTCTVPPRAGDRFLFVAAGTDSPDRVRAGDMRLFRLGE